MKSHHIKIALISFFVALLGACSDPPPTAGDTCNDGIQNGDETGVDCGGSCEPCNATWKEITLPVTTYMYGVCFVDNNVGWAVGQNGVLLKSTDGGYTWLNQTSPFKQTLKQIEFLDDKTGFIVGTDGILKTKDAGENWYAVYNAPSTNGLGAIDFITNKIGYAGGSDEEVILKTIDGGETWTELTVPADLDPRGYYDIGFLNENFGYAVGTAASGKAAIYTDDGGKTWKEVGIYHPCPIYTIDCFEGKYVRASGYYFFTTESGGKSWSTNLEIKKEGKMSRACFLNKDEGWVIGENGFVYHTTDACETWEKGEKQLTSETVRWLHYNDDAHGWAIGPRGVVFIYDTK